MTEEAKLILALMQVNNLICIVHGNEYQQFLHNHLISVQVELQRQLTNLTHSSKIKE